MLVKRATGWAVIHGAHINTTPTGIEFSDTQDSDWHLMSLDEQRFEGRHLNLKIEALPSKHCNTDIYVNHDGGNDVLIVSPRGKILGGAYHDQADVTLLPDGTVRIVLLYFSNSPRVNVGTSKGSQTAYAGSGNVQYVFKTLEISPAERASNDKLVFVDVGAAGGVPDNWVPHINDVHAVLFDPFHEEGSSSSYPSAQVYQTALSDKTGPATFHITRFPYCSSLLEPDHEVLKRYSVASCFDVVKTVQVDCTRYDELPNAPIPDMIKMDVQGMEYGVLEGFGKHLDHVLGIVLESHFYPIYKEQRVVQDLVDMLGRHGLRLNAIHPVMSFDRDLVEVNLYFTRADGLAERDLWKIDIIRKTLGLAPVDWLGAQLQKMFPRPIS